MKKLLLLMLTISLGLIIVGCSNDTKEADNPSNEDAIELTEEEEGFLEDLEAMEEEALEAEENPHTLEDFKEAFESVGYVVGDSQEVDYDRVYADDGIKFEVDGQLVELYKYDNAMDMSEEAEHFISYPEDRPPMTFDGNDTPAETAYGDNYMGIYDVPGFLLVFGKDYKAPLNPTNPDQNPPDSIPAVFMWYSMVGNSAD